MNLYNRQFQSLAMTAFSGDWSNFNASLSLNLRPRHYLVALAYVLMCSEQLQHWLDIKVAVAHDPMTQHCDTNVAIVALISTKGVHLDWYIQSHSDPLTDMQTKESSCACQAWAPNATQKKCFRNFQKAPSAQWALLSQAMMLIPQPYWIVQPSVLPPI